MKLYTVDDDLSEMIDEDMKYEGYWDEVGKKKDGDWGRCEVLPRFVRALGTVFNGNSETESAFSVQCRQYALALALVKLISH